MKIKAIVFDMDGTIVDSKLSFQKMREDIGLPPHAKILDSIEESEDEEFKQMAYAVLKKHEDLGVEQASLIRDIASFLSELHQRKIPTAVLTRNSKEAALKTFQKFNLEFDFILSRNCAAPKPSPEGLEVMAKEWSINIEDILFIGDYDFDIETAINAGAKSALIKWPYNKKWEELADICFDNFAELYPYLAK